MNARKLIAIKEWRSASDLLTDPPPSANKLVSASMCTCPLPSLAQVVQTPLGTRARLQKHVDFNICIRHHVLRRVVECIVRLRRGIDSKTHGELKLALNEGVMVLVLPHDRAERDADGHADKGTLRVIRILTHKGCKGTKTLRGNSCPSRGPKSGRNTTIGHPRPLRPLLGIP